MSAWQYAWQNNNVGLIAVIETLANQSAMKSLVNLSIITRQTYSWKGKENSISYGWYGNIPVSRFVDLPLFEEQILETGSIASMHTRVGRRGR